MNNKNLKISTNKSFAYVFAVVFIIIGIYSLLNNEDPRYWSLIVSLILLILGYKNSLILTPFNSIWFKFGLLLGSVFAPIIMSLVYFLVVYPTNLFLKVFKKNQMGIKYNGNIKTYWVEAKNNNNMKDQF